MFKKIAFVLPVFFILQCSLPEIDDITPPVTMLVYPYEGAVISEDIDVLISASDDNEVAEVWYYLDGKQTSSTKESPYEIPLQIAGLEKKVSHTIQAAAKDKDGNIGYSTAVTFTVAETQDIIDPVVTIVNPLGGQVVEGIVNVVANAEDERSIQKVAFYINGDSLGLDTTYPYTYSWNTENYSDSTQHTIYARAWDGGNNIATSPVINVTVYPRTGIQGDSEAPTALILYPIGGSTVAGVVKVSVDIADNVSLDSLAFFVDGILETAVSDPSSPWTYDWNTVPLADSLAHALYFKVFDGAGNYVTVTSTVTIYSVVSANPDVTAPTIEFLYPIAGSTVAGDITVAADFADDRVVSKIEFYVDGILETSSTTPSSPWVYSWDTSSKADSLEHNLYLKAYDSAGNIGTATNTVTVFSTTSSAEPDVSIPTAAFLYPLAGTEITGNVQVSVDLFDNVGVTRAEFYVDGVLSTSANNPSVPWIFTWNTASKADGLLHSIYVKVYDAAGNIGTTGLTTLTVN
jgi:hypothetical protein